MKFITFATLILFSLNTLGANLSTLVGAGSNTDDLKTKNAGTYNRDNHSLEALRERIDILESKLAAMESTLTSVSTDTASIKSDVSTISSSGGNLSWSTATSDQTVSVGNAYAVSGANRVSLTLPATCTAGEVVRFNSGSTAGFILRVNTGQKILYNGEREAVTVQGFSAIDLTCVADNTTWLVKSFDGELGNIGSITTLSGNNKIWASKSNSTNAVCGNLNGTLHCWGDNTHGKLGIGNLEDQSVPVEVIGAFTDIIKVVYSANTTCALTSAGAVKCWGQGTNGRLGNSTDVTYSREPVNATGLSSGVTDIFASASSFSAIKNGALYSWGHENTNGHGTHQNTPTIIPALSSSVTAVFSDYGGNYNFAEKNGGLYSWGTSAVYNGRPNVNNKIATIMDNIPEGTGISDVQCTNGGCFALSTGGKVFGWGNRREGNVGDGYTSSTNSYLYSTYEMISSGATQIVASYLYGGCAVVSGAAKCWGNGDDYRNGDGSNNDNGTPTNVTNATTGVTQIATSGNTVCAIKSGAVYCWGRGNDGTIGDGASTLRTTATAALVLTSSVTKIMSAYAPHASYDYSGFIAEMNGKLYSWGIGNRYGLANGLETDVSTPTLIPLTASGYEEILPLHMKTSNTRKAGFIKVNGIYHAFGSNDDVAPTMGIDSFADGDFASTIRVKGQIDP